MDQNLSCSFKGNQQSSVKAVLELHLENKQVYLKISLKKCHVLINKNYNQNIFVKSVWRDLYL